MMDLLEHKVARATVIEDRYQAKASIISINVHLEDWYRAKARLDRQIVELERLAAERLAQVEAGQWP